MIQYPHMHMSRRFEVGAKQVAAIARSLYIEEPNIEETHLMTFTYNFSILPP